jgi:hypothetical protein
MAVILADSSPAGQLPSVSRRPAMPENGTIVSEKI